MSIAAPHMIAKTVNGVSGIKDHQKNAEKEHDLHHADCRFLAYRVPALVKNGHRFPACAIEDTRSFVRFGFVIMACLTDSVGGAPLEWCVLSLTVWCSPDRQRPCASRTHPT